MLWDVGFVSLSHLDLRQSTAAIHVGGAMLMCLSVTIFHQTSTQRLAPSSDCIHSAQHAQPRKVGTTFNISLISAGIAVRTDKKTLVTHALTLRLHHIWLPIPALIEHVVA
jgi:hypothetical protein